MKTVNSPSDLVTTQEATIDGFAWQANQKLEKAKEFESQVEYFRSKIGRIKDTRSILKDNNLFDFFTAACMLSKKSLNHLTEDLLNEILDSLVDFDKLHNPKYVRELERRYLLSSGDSLGGSMRNIVGNSAQVEFSERIIKRLIGKGIHPEVIRNRKKTKVQEILYPNRRILFDKTPKFIGKNIDLLVIEDPSALTGNLENPRDYLCCGELKGGIDPAGADEHWKTAKSALERIRQSFIDMDVKPPKLIFLGKAIEKSMAEEIFNLLEEKWLTGAGNMNYSEQLDEVISIILE